MALALKVGMVVFVVFAGFAGSVGISAAGITCFPSCSIRIDDLTETPTAHMIINNASGPPSENLIGSGELMTFTLFGIQGATGGVRFSDLFEGSLTGPVSDRLLVTVIVDGLTTVTFTFGSDVAVAVPPGAQRMDALVEDGTAQSLPLLTATLGPMITSITVASDVEAVPEPATLVLLGGPVAGLLAMAWRRRRQRESRP